MIWEWVKEHAWWLTATSLVTFVGSLILLPVLVVRMPADYFVEDRVMVGEEISPLLRVLALVGKNLLGVLLLIAGIAMLFIPGQGLLTMLMGLALMDFPGKRAAEVRMVRMPKVNRALNWIRRKYGREELQVP